MSGSWESFFVAQVGASAALTGLVFVALSINLERIIGNETLVGAEAWQRSRGQFVNRVVLVQVAVLPTIIGGAVLLSGSSSGLDWVAVGAAVSLVVGILDAWVLIVEILR